MIKVLLVEDETLWQQGIAALIADSGEEIGLSGIVDNADDAEVFCKADPPDVILLDWKIKGARDGMQLAESLAKDFSPRRMILVTGSPPEQIPPHPYHYVPKSRIASDLVPQILSCLKE